MTDLNVHAGPAVPARSEVQPAPDAANGTYRLASAEILYHMPDQPHLLQTFVWQTLDSAPDFPRLINFITAWRTEIKARLHSVRITSGGSVTPLILDRATFGVTLQ